MTISTGFTTIKSWTDVRAFAGQVVAVRADSPYFNHGKKALILDPSKSLTGFGYVSRNAMTWPGIAGAKQGHKIDVLLKKGASDSISALIDSRISKALFEIRLATEQELDLIKNAIETSQAFFTYHHTNPVPWK